MTLHYLYCVVDNIAFNRLILISITFKLYPILPMLFSVKVILYRCQSYLYINKNQRDFFLHDKAVGKWA